MKKEANIKREGLTILFSVAIIIVMVLIGFNLRNITSYNVSDIQTSTKIEVYPKTEIEAGNYINVEIFPGTKCVDRRAYIYYAAGTGVKATLQPAGTSKQKLCEPFTLSYKTSAEWSKDPGVYYVKVFDYGTKDFVKDIFVIRGE